MSKNNMLTEKWGTVLDAVDENEVAINGLSPVEKSQRHIVAQILENQEKDSHDDIVTYQDAYVVKNLKHLMGEAMVDGDHGYDPDNIAKGTNTGNITNAGGAVIGLVRRAIPNMLPFEIAGVQAMKQSTQQIFSFHAIYGGSNSDQDAREAFHPANAPNTMHSGQGAAVTIADFVDTKTDYVSGALFKHETATQSGHDLRFYQVVTNFNASTAVGDTPEDKLLGLQILGTIAEIAMGMATSIAELQEGFNGSTNNPWNEMSFRIDKQTVEAKERQLKAQYTIELAQDLKATHGLSVDSELSNLLATEIMLEINREVVQWINATAQIGKSGWTNTQGGAIGVFDFSDPKDVMGARWRGEATKALIAQIDKEANEIARQTGRGAGNFIIASRNVVSALGQTDVLVGPAAHGMNKALNADTTKSVFAGVLGGKYKVYIDQYAPTDYFTVGFKGSSEFDAGIYYCPYVMMTPLRATDYRSFQPVLGFKTRYGIAINPLADPKKDKVSAMKSISSQMPDVSVFGKNSYFRRVWVKGV